MEIGYVTFFPSTVQQVEDKNSEEKSGHKLENGYYQQIDRKSDSSPF